MDFLVNYGLFLAKSITLVVAVLVVIVFAVSAGLKNQSEQEGHIEVTKVNQKYEDILNMFKSAILDEEDYKVLEKRRKKEEKEQKKAHKKQLKEESKLEKSRLKNSAPHEKHNNAEEKNNASEKSNAAEKVGDEEIESTDSSQVEELPEDSKPKVFILDFVGDVKASATEELRRVITAVLAVATKQDEIVVRLESPGGMVHSYGLASSQLARITSKEIPLTVCVDKVAASGGYMMACVANKIISAPFAVIGSIGVIAQLPNFHKILKKNDIDFEMLTAGEYKRTLTMFGENTDKGRKKFVEDLEDTHVLFKEFVAEHRTSINVDEVATGEIWFGRRALEKNLVDSIATSDEYINEKISTSDLYQVSYVQKKSIAAKLGMGIEAGVERVIANGWQKLNNRIFS